MKKIFFLFIMLISAMGMQAQSNNDAFDEEINKYLELQHIEVNFFNSMRTVMKPLVDKGALSENKLDLICKEITQMYIPKMRAVVGKLCREHYTLDEMKQLNVYLASPLGQKSIILMPKFMEEGMKTAQLPEFQSKVQEIVARHMAE